MTVSRDPTALATSLVGGVWGHLVGDAVGVPHRASRKTTIELDIQERFVREWTTSIGSVPA